MAHFFFLLYLAILLDLGIMLVPADNGWSSFLGFFAVGVFVGTLVAYIDNRTGGN